MINDKIIIDKFTIIHRVPKSCKIELQNSYVAKSLCKTYLVTDDGLYDRKAFSTKILFLFILYNDKTCWYITDMQPDQQTFSSFDIKLLQHLFKNGFGKVSLFYVYK